MSCFSSMLTIVLLLVAGEVRAQTVCMYRVPVPELAVCDSSGGLEETTQGHLYETKGTISGLHDFQEDNFRMFDEQFRRLTRQTGQTEGDLGDVLDQVNNLKEILEGLTGTNSSAVQYDTKEKRIGPNPALLSVNAAQQTFDQAMLDLTNKIQKLAKTLDDTSRAGIAFNANATTRIQGGQQALKVIEARVTALEQTLQQVPGLPTSPGAANGVDLGNVTQEVLQLRVDALAARTIAQRGMDAVENAVRNMEAAEGTTERLIQSVTPIHQDVDTRLLSLNQQQTILNGSFQFYQNQQTTFEQSQNAVLGQVKQGFQKVENYTIGLGRTVFDAVMRQNEIHVNTTSVEQRLNTQQSVTSFSAQLAQGQKGDILRLKQIDQDNLKTLLYAFAVTNTFP